MNKKFTSIQKLIYGLCALGALIIIIDFLSPGELKTEKIIDIQKEKENYNNAAGNYHYSYEVLTSSSRFSVSEEIAKKVKGNEEIEFATSFIFKEVNWYSIQENREKNIDSLRLASGLLVPLITLIILGFSFFRNKELSTLVFIVQLLLLADLIYLIL
ncbi:MAG: hypothetical protein AAF487_07230 [Bacteroidota bacterium]